MGENDSSSSGRSTFERDAQCFCGSVRSAFEKAAEAFLPPEEARHHFRQARVELWKGIRELVDSRISHLNRDDSKGARVVVD